MKFIFRFIIVVCLLFVACPHASAESGSQKQKAGEVKKAVRAAGSCAIAGMGAEQSQLLALHRARAAAIRKASGIKALSEIRTTSYEQSMGDVEAYGKGFIVREKVNLLRPSVFGKKSPPIPDHRVWIIADVHIPGAPPAPLGLKASLNKSTFNNGEKGKLAIRTEKETGVAIFLMRADDKVAMIFPNIHEVNNIIPSGRDFIFPAKDGLMDLDMQTMAGRHKDIEAFFVVAWDKASKIKAVDLFPDTDPLGFSEFFGRLSTIGSLIEIKVLPYTVTAAQKQGKHKD